MTTEFIEIEKLQVGVRLRVSDALARSLEMETQRDASLQATEHYITGWFTSRKIFEETREYERPLGWRDRIRVLFGKPVVQEITVEMRHNCPHLDLEPWDRHVAWLAPDRSAQ